jgi:hypothetical protein
MTASAEPATGARAVEGRVPDFFIVGHHKCGTTALYEMLRQHPQIFLPQMMEPRYFASDIRSRFPPADGEVRAWGRPSWGSRLPRTLSDYLSLFADATPEQRVGDGTPAYLFSHTAAANIAQAQPAARHIAILREPASFLHSLHQQLLRSHVETEKDLRKAISLETARSEGRHIPGRSYLPQLLQYSDHVRYVDQLRRFEAHFPPEQMLVLIYDDFRRDNQATLRTVLRFLDVDEDYPIEEVNIKKTVRTVRSHELDDLLRSVSLGQSRVARAARAMVKALTPQARRHQAFRAARVRGVLRDAPPLDDDLMIELRRRYKPEVVALSEYLDRDLVALWGYDAIE